MKTIWKFPLEVTDVCTVSMPAGARVLYLAVQGDTPTIWALVDPDAPRAERTFLTHGTGHPFPHDHPYIGSYQLYGGSLVFHVFESRSW